MPGKSYGERSPRPAVRGSELTFAVPHTPTPRMRAAYTEYNVAPKRSVPMTRNPIAETIASLMPRAKRS